MSRVARALVPSLASFGPLFMVFGLLGQVSVLTDGDAYARPYWLSASMAYAGALMTGVAVLMVYREVFRQGQDAGSDVVRRSVSSSDV
ncbi:MAG: hypothetical protein CMM84_12675 [Rhodothermaceae bacterium]|nr:hypothetical protein [Rhodothermaceae bacterium]MBC11633.1 hypothetical protein [Rhodothermaceae bacterium]